MSNRDQKRNMHVGGVPAGTNGTGGSYAETDRTRLDRDKVTDSKPSTPGPDAFGFDMGEDWQDIDESTYDYRDLRSGDLGAADFSGQSMKGVLLERRHYPGLNVRGANLTGARMSGGVFSDADFREADLSGAYSDASLFTNCDFRFAVMDDAQLQGRWRDTDLTGLVATNSALSMSHMTAVSAQDTSFVSTDLRSSNFNNVNFNRTAITDGNHGERSNLSNTEMFKTTFRDARICGTDMDSVQARECDFTAASLIDVNLDCAEFTCTDFTLTFTDKVSLRGAKFTKCVFGGATIAGQLDANTRFTDCDLTRATFVLADNPDNRAAADAVLEAGAVIDWK